MVTVYVEVYLVVVTVTVAIWVLVMVDMVPSTTLVDVMVLSMVL